MYRPQKLLAALFSAALLCTTGIALADKGGNHDKHGGSSQGPATPGQSSGGSNSKSSRGPGGIGGPQSAPGSFDRSMSRKNNENGEFEGSVDDRDMSGGAKAGIKVKLSNGATQTFEISDSALNSLKAHQGHGDLIFFTNGQQITAVCSRGEKDTMRVTARTGDTFTLQDRSGQTRLITLDARTANRLHVKVGSNVAVTAMSATSGKIVALDLVKQHSFDKFARGLKSDVDVDVAKADVDRAKVDIDSAKAKKAKKADIDDVDADIAAVKTDIDMAKGKKSKKLDVDVAKLDNDKRKLDVDVDVAKAKKSDVDVDTDVAKADIDRAKVDVDMAKSKKAKKADIDTVQADIDAVKSDIDTGKGKKSKKLDVDVAKLDNDNRNMDVDVAMSACGHASSRHGNPAFANQMAKDAANDASGHNPPGLPHECVNPAGHTRGFCKSSSSASICGGGMGSSGGESDTDVAASNSGKCGPGASRHGNPAFANQMAKDAANDASGHNPPGLPHECVNPAGHTRGFCKSSSSESLCGGSGTSSGGESEVASNTSKPCAPGTSSHRSGNPAFANQMAKDAANDASGHNPPGLPHECVNPAGHTRGFCKNSESESSAMCGSSGSGSGIAPSELHGGIANRAPAPGVNAGVPVPGNGGVANRAPAPGTNAGAPIGSRLSNVNGATRGPGAPVGFIPVGGGQFGTSSGATRGPGTAGAPTHVLGAATGPTARTRHIAAVPTRVLPVAIQPVGKRRCVWYKTGVLGASTGPYRIVGTSAISGKPVLHKKCR
jgi:hypothetical protein